MTCDQGLVYMVVPSSSTSTVRRLDSPKKRTTLKRPGPFRGLLVEGERWTASGEGGVYHSTNAGDDWTLDSVDGTSDVFHSIVRWDDTLWVASVTGKLAFKDKSGWTSLERPEAPPFGRYGTGTNLPYPRLGISKLVVAGDSLYALGDGLWRIDRSGATLELASALQLVGLAETKAKTLLVGGVGRTLFRRPLGGDWEPVERDANPPPEHILGRRWSGDLAAQETCIEIIDLEAGTLFVGPTGSALHVSTDDGRTLTPLTAPLGLTEHLARYRFHAAIADQQGGAIVAGWGGLLVRVAPDPHRWTPVKKPRSKGQGRARSAKTIGPAAVDPNREMKLLASVFAHRDDDEPRLVLADWLTDHADPRGEFISLQCQLGRAIWGAEGHLRDDSNPRVANVLSLVARERQIYKKHRRGWLAPFDGAVRKYRFRRGFLEGFSSNPALFNVAEPLFRAHPVEEVRLEGLAKGDFEKLKSTTFRGVRHFALPRQRMTNDELETVLDAAFVSELESLDLWANEFGDEGARTLAARLPPNIKSLKVSFCGVTVDGVLAILDATDHALETLDVRLRSFSAPERATLEAHPRGQILQ